jgi:2,3-bisphosphoglycerate-independent phosphoglycerate mutase
VEPPEIERTLGQYLSQNGATQIAIAETQKYGHVTYFWNGNCSGLYDPKSGRYVDVPSKEESSPNYTVRARRSELESYLEVPSDVVPFEERPWMKAAEVTDALIAELRSGKFTFARVNYANGDMVGHTGDMEAAIIAVSVVDRCLGRLLEVIDELDGLALITADHGNADEMLMPDKKGGFKTNAAGRIQPKTSHTLNNVPFILYDPRGELELDQTVSDAGLSNVAATVLNLLGYQAPEDYRQSLLKR